MTDIGSALAKRTEEAVDFLCDLIRFPSTPGNEKEALGLCAERFSELGLEAKKVPLSDALKSDPDYSDPIAGLKYDGRFNVRLRWPGCGGGRSLLFNTHADVVPPSQMQESPFGPRVESETVYGRGACDAKGQIATLFLTIAVLRDCGFRPRGDILAHLVVEEECGGNGTLAMIRKGEESDAAVVMEPTAMKISPSVRGAVWFRLTCTGRAGHSGQAGKTVSALLSAVEAIGILEQYHADLLAKSRGIPLFDRFENPMPITFGKLVAGDWPATAPQKAEIEGVLGLLPNRTAAEVMAEMEQAICENGSEWLREHYELQFMYRHDAHVLNPAHVLVRVLADSCGRSECETEISAMTASCDSWFYNNQLGIPTVVFGAGDLRYAHSNQEQIAVKDMTDVARVLARFIPAWCSEAPQP